MLDLSANEVGSACFCGLLDLYTYKHNGPTVLPAPRPRSPCNSRRVVDSDSTGFPTIRRSPIRNLQECCRILATWNPRQPGPQRDASTHKADGPRHDRRTARQPGGRWPSNSSPRQLQLCVRNLMRLWADPLGIPSSPSICSEDTEDKIGYQKNCIRLQGCGTVCQRSVMDRGRIFMVSVPEACLVVRLRKYASMYIYIYIYIYMHIHIYMYTHIYIFTFQN